MNVSGAWKGEIIYGKEYTQHKGKTLCFELKISQTEQTISGISKDIAGMGINPGAAKITGHVHGRSLNFIKQYDILKFPKGYTNLGSVFNGPKILYFGEFNDATRKFEGTWQITVKRIFFGLIPINRPSSGTWKMNRLNQ